MWTQPHKHKVLVEDSLVMPHANSQDGFSEGELQHQLVFGVT